MHAHALTTISYTGLTYKVKGKFGTLVYELASHVNFNRILVDPLLLS